MNNLDFRASRPDLLASVLLGAVGGAGMWFGRSLPVGTSSAMGPGYLPLGISWILLIMAAALIGRALMRGDERIPHFRIRPTLILILATILFGVLLERIGLIATILIVAVVSSFAGEHTHLARRLLLAASLATGCVLIFVYLLGQPIALWWP
jgi:Tripartite tricarboxylate transporter TctB family